eukprot:6822688-Pyramimonas_sp.AAC.1
MVAVGARVEFQIGSRHFHDVPVRPARAPRTRVLRSPHVLRIFERRATSGFCGRPSSSARRRGWPRTPRRR